MSLSAALLVPRGALALPAAALGPLAYWVLLSSCAAYSILTAATRHLPASVVSAFICLQPVAGAAAAVGVLGERPSPWDAGALLIVAGLAAVLPARSGPPLAAGDAEAAATVPRSRPASRRHRESASLQGDVSVIETADSGQQLRAGSTGELEQLLRRSPAT